MCPGFLLSWADWGPGQPSGGDQHCLYLVGGRLGHQWADFNCTFDMNFLCEMDVNPANPWHHPWPQVGHCTALNCIAPYYIH